MLKAKGIISPIQKKILQDIGKLKESEHFYLSGGTALAEFYFGHRRSYDLDIFTSEKELIIPFSRLIESDFPPMGYIIKVVKRFESFVELTAGDQLENIVIHIGQESPFRFGNPVESEYGIKINAYDDIITDKVLTYFGRWQYRDAVDLFFILQRENLDKLINMACQKDPGFDLYWFSVSLTKAEKFPDDIKNWLVDMLIDVDANQIKKSLNDLALTIIDRVRKKIT